MVTEFFHIATAYMVHRYMDFSIMLLDPLLVGPNGLFCKFSVDESSSQLLNFLKLDDMAGVSLNSFVGEIKGFS